MSIHLLESTIHRLRNSGEANQELLARFASREDADAFTALVERHGAMVLNVCARVLDHDHDAEDAFQATFLTLALKAQTIRQSTSLASWLHGVALRCALKIKRHAARRVQRERRAASEEHYIDRSDLPERELRAVVDEELQQLPEIYRVPFVLCCLQEKTKSAAARELGWKEGTLSGRLARARQRLQKRLIQRGVTPAGIAALGAITQTCSVSARLAESTANLVHATIKRGTATIPASVNEVAQLVTQSMTISKLRLAAIVMILVGLAVGTSVLVGLRSVTAQPPTTPITEEKPVPPSEPRDLYGDPLPPGAVARLGSARLYHGERVRQVMFADDGKQVVTMGDDHRNRLWGVPTGREIPLPKPVQKAQLFRANGQLAVIEQGGDGFRLHTLAELKDNPLPEKVSLYPLQNPGIVSADVTANGEMMIQAVSLVVIGERGGTITFSDLTGKNPPDKARLSGPPQGMALSADGSTVAVVLSDGTVEIWDVAKREFRISAALGAKSWACALSPDGKILAVSDAKEDQKRIHLWDTENLKELPALDGQLEKAVQSLTFSPDGKTLAACYPSPEVWLYDLPTRKLREKLHGKNFQVYHTAFSADGQLIALADADEVSVWDMKTGKSLHDLGHTYAIWALAFSPDGQTIASGAAYTDKLGRVWNPLTGELKATLPGHTAGLEEVAYSPDGQLLATGSQDRTIKIWDTTNHQEIRTLKPNDGMVYGMAFTPDGKQVVSGGVKKIHFFDVKTGKEVRTLDNPGQFILTVVFTPDGQTMATRGRSEKEIRIWDVARGRVIRSLSVETIPTGVSFSPDGHRLAIGDWQKDTVTIWDWRTGEKKQVLTPIEEGRKGKRVYSALFSPDGRTLAVGYSDESIRVWELASGQVRRQFQGHQSSVLGLAYSPDGSFLASGSSDRTVLIWDVFGGYTEDFARTLDEKTIAKLWNDLASDEADDAFKAIKRLSQGNEKVVSLLRGRLQPVEEADPELVAKLIENLDHPRFAVREKATQELLKIGEPAAGALRKALEVKPSAELRRRAEMLLDRFEGIGNPQRLRERRAVEILERIGTPKAQELLKDLAAGTEDARLTRDARESLQRLNK